MSRRHALTEAQWEWLAPLLPPATPPSGKPEREHRVIVNAIAWKLRTGAAWRDLPERCGPWSTGVQPLPPRAAGRGRGPAGRGDPGPGGRRGVGEWAVHVVDGTVVRAHQHAAGAEGGSGNGGAGAQPGWRQRPGPPPRGGRRHADDAGATPGPGAGGDRLGAAAGAGGGAATRARPPPGAAEAGGGRQGRQRAPARRRRGAAGHPLLHAPPAQRAPPRPRRPHERHGCANGWSG